MEEEHISEQDLRSEEDVKDSLSPFDYKIIGPVIEDLGEESSKHVKGTLATYQDYNVFAIEPAKQAGGTCGWNAVCNALGLMVELKKAKEFENLIRSGKQTHLLSQTAIETLRSLFFQDKGVDPGSVSQFENQDILNEFALYCVGDNPRRLLSASEEGTYPFSLFTGVGMSSPVPWFENDIHNSAAKDKYYTKTSVAYVRDVIDKMRSFGMTDENIVDQLSMYGMKYISQRQSIYRSDDKTIKKLVQLEETMVSTAVKGSDKGVFEPIHQILGLNNSGELEGVFLTSSFWKALVSFQKNAQVSNDIHKRAEDESLKEILQEYAALGISALAFDTNLTDTNHPPFTKSISIVFEHCDALKEWVLGTGGVLTWAYLQPVPSGHTSHYVTKAFKIENGKPTFALLDSLGDSSNIKLNAGDIACSQFFASTIFTDENISIIGRVFRNLENHFDFTLREEKFASLIEDRFIWHNEKHKFTDNTWKSFIDEINSQRKVPKQYAIQSQAASHPDEDEYPFVFPGQTVEAIPTAEGWESPWYLQPVSQDIIQGIPVHETQQQDSLEDFFGKPSSVTITRSEPINLIDLSTKVESDPYEITKNFSVPITENVDINQLKEEFADVMNKLGPYVGKNVPEISVEMLQNFEDEKQRVEALLRRVKDEKKQMESSFGEESEQKQVEVEDVNFALSGSEFKSVKKDKTITTVGQLRDKAVQEFFPNVSLSKTIPKPFYFHIFPSNFAEYYADSDLVENTNYRRAVLDLKFTVSIVINMSGEGEEDPIYILSYVYPKDPGFVEAIWADIERNSDLNLSAKSARCRTQIRDALMKKVQSKELFDLTDDIEITVKCEKESADEDEDW